MGAVSPVGNSAPESWESLRAGRGGIAPITHFDASKLPVRIAGEVKGFDAAAIFGTKEARRGTPHVHFAMAAAREAALDSGLDIAAETADVGVLIASGIGGLEVIEKTTRILDAEGARRVSPFAAAMALVDMAPGMVSIDLGARGPNMAVVSACASGADAIGQAANWVRQRRRRGGARRRYRGGHHLDRDRDVRRRSSPLGAQRRPGACVATVRSGTRRFRGRRRVSGARARGARARARQGRDDPRGIARLCGVRRRVSHHRAGAER